MYCFLIVSEVIPFKENGKEKKCNKILQITYNKYEFKLLMNAF